MTRDAGPGDLTCPFAQHLASPVELMFGHVERGDVVEDLGELIGDPAGS